MVDEHLRKSASPDSKVRYLLDLLGDASAEAFLYSDDGPPAGTPRPTNLDDGVEAPNGWVEIGPGATDRLRLVKWIKEGRSTEGVITIEDSAFTRVIDAEPPDEYSARGSPEALRLADAHAMLAANKIQADLFVTDRELPFALGRDSWSHTTLMTPGDALPVVGLYLRRQRRFLLAKRPGLGDPDQPVSETARDRSYFYWEAAELLLRDSWRWRIACDTHSKHTGDRLLSLLYTTVVHRLSQALRSRDALLAGTSVTQNMDTADDILNELDVILMFLMAGFDSLARVCNAVLRIPKSDRLAGWQRKDWITEVQVLNAPLANLFAPSSSGEAQMTLLSKLRNNIHGPAISAGGMVPVVGDSALETFVALPHTDRTEILDAVTRLGGLATWGIIKPFADYELHIQPAVFVETLIPQSIWLMNQIMTTTPVELLDGIKNPKNFAPGELPRNLFSERLVWQLGLDSPIATT